MISYDIMEKKRWYHPLFLEKYILTLKPRVSAAKFSTFHLEMDGGAPPLDNSEEELQTVQSKWLNNDGHLCLSRPQSHLHGCHKCSLWEELVHLGSDLCWCKEELPWDHQGRNVGPHHVLVPRDEDEERSGCQHRALPRLCRGRGGWGVSGVRSRRHQRGNL